MLGVGGTMGAEHHLAEGADDAGGRHPCVLRGQAARRDLVGEMGGEQLGVGRAVAQTRRLDLRPHGLGEQGTGQHRRSLGPSTPAAERGREALGAERARHGIHLSLADRGEHLDRQLGLAVEVPVDRARGDTRFLGDRAHLEQREAPTSHALARRLQQRRTGGSPSCFGLRGGAIGHRPSKV